MTKKELIEQIAHLPDDAIIVVQTYNCPEQLTCVQYTEHSIHGAKVIKLSEE